MSRTYTVRIQSEAFPITLSKERQSIGALRQELANLVRVETDQITLISAQDDASSASDSGSTTTLTDEHGRLLGDKDILSEDCVEYEAVVPIKFVPVSRFPHIKKRVFAGRIGMILGDTLENILSLRGPPGSTRVSYDGPGDQQLIHGDAIMMSQSHDDLYFAKMLGPTSKSKVLSTLQDAIDAEGILTGSDSSNIRKASRRLLNPAFTKQALEGYANIMHDSLDEALIYFDRHASDGTDFDLGRSLRRLTWQTVERIVVGKGPQRFKARLDKDGVPASHLNEQLQWLLQTAFRRALYPKALRRLSNKKWQRTIQELNDWMDKIILNRRNDSNAVPQTHDVLQHCLETSLDDGTRMSDDQIRHTCLTLVAAGTDTTAITLSTILHQLSINPNIQQKCLAELAKVGLFSDSQRPTLEQLNQVDYLEWIILEALRWLPPSPGIGKNATHKCAIQSGDVAADERILFHQGDWIFTSFVMMSFNELYYGKDVFSFNPERWTPQERKARHPYCDAFFSAGSRNCIGRILAMQELKIILSTLILRYELKPVTIKPKLSIDLLWRHENLHVRFVHRCQTYKSGPKPGESLATVSPINKKDKSTAWSISEAQQKQIAASLPSKIFIAYASGMGESRRYAKELYDMWRALSLDAKQVEMLTLDELFLPASSSSFKQSEYMVNVVASTYNGLPPKGATEYAARYGELNKEVTQDSSAKLTYAVFGCGNRDWRSTYQKFPKQVQDWLAKRQFSEALIELGQGNAEDDQLKDWREWRAEMLCRVIKHYSLPLEVSKDAANSFFTKVDDYSSLDVKLSDCPPGAKESVSLQQGKVTASRELQDTAKSGRSTLDVCIELPNDIRFQSKEGYHLLIHPRNNDEIVDRVLACIQMSRGCAETKVCSLTGKARAGSAAEKLLLEQKTPSIVNVIAEYLDLLSAPSQDFLLEALSLAKVTGDRKLSLQLEEAIKGTTRGVRTNLAVLEQLGSCDLVWVLNNCPVSTPRRYSIANSTSIDTEDEGYAECNKNETKSQVRLLVSVVDEDGLLGQVSGHVLAASKLGTYLRCSVDPAPFGQRVADGDWSKPTVMIATGTGLAPFLSFLEKKSKDDLRKQCVAADTHLILGCRSDYDQLCKEELEQYISSGTLTGLHVAHSRTTQGKRQYVSDILIEKAELFSSLWEQGAIFYVCGRASSIQEALDKVARSSVKLVNEDSSTLTSQGRLIEDIWMR